MSPTTGPAPPARPTGLVCTSALLAVGAPPALASASVHATEVVTSGLAGGSHLRHRNVEWGLFRRLAPAGVAGGGLGACMLTELPGAAVQVLVAVSRNGGADRRRADFLPGRCKRQSGTRAADGVPGFHPRPAGACGKASPGSSIGTKRARPACRATGTDRR